MVQHSRSWKTTRRLCQGRETSSTFRIGTKMRTHGANSQYPNHQTPRKGQHPCPCLPTLLVARDEYLDREPCCRVHTLPTKQNTHHQEEDSTVLHPRQPLHMPIQCHHPRPHHPTTKSKWTQCHTHCCRPTILQSSIFIPCNMTIMGEGVALLNISSPGLGCHPRLSLIETPALPCTLRKP